MSFYLLPDDHAVDVNRSIPLFLVLRARQAAIHPVAPNDITVAKASKQQQINASPLHYQDTASVSNKLIHSLYMEPPVEHASQRG